MDPNTFYHKMSRIVGLDLCLIMQDTVYMLKRQNHPEQYKKYLDDLKERYRNSVIMGGSFGLALLFSLRRYFPATFNQFSLNRLLIETTLLGGALVGSTISVVVGGSKLVHHMKKDYIIKADPDIYQYMGQFARRYKVDEETQVRHTLSTEQYNQWKKVRMMAGDHDEKSLI